MPDISGYTSFVNHTETEHSGHIIAELLELLLDADTLGLNLAEIEGDALFLYKTGDIPSLEEIKMQVRKMFKSFHEHLLLYKHRRVCDCGACSSASGLTLKFIVHIADIDFITVRDNVKPYGPEVVKVHRLLKNEIANKEYILLSKEACSYLECSTEVDLKTYKTEYDFGLAEYSSIDISSYKNELSPLPDLIRKKAKTMIYETSIEIQSPIAEVYEVVSNLAYRSLWSEGVDTVEFDRKKVNRAGTFHKCLVNGNHLEFETIKADSLGEQLVYSEKTKSVPFTTEVDNMYVFSKTEKGTKIQVSFYVTFKKFMSVVKYFLVPQLKRSVKNNLLNLKRISEEKGLAELSRETIDE
jgi:hypothetical protein